MKHLSYCLLLFLSCFGCTRQREGLPPDHRFDTVRLLLKDSIDANLYQQLDFDQAVYYRSKDSGAFFMRIPIGDKAFAADFLLCKFPASQRSIEGRWVHLQADTAAVFPGGWNGQLITRSLNGQIQLNSRVSDGFIASLHESARVETKEAMLPEVVVVTYLSGESYTYATALLFDMLMRSGGVSYDAGYGTLYNGSGSGGSATGNGGYPKLNDLEEFDLEYIYAKLSIDLQKYLACFDNVASDGAIYTIRLCADIPSNNDPSASSAGAGISAGHSFVTLTKSNGTNAVTQSFGFYPETAPSMANPFQSVPSTMKDNGANEYNAGIEMKITGAQFNNIIVKAGVSALISYNLTSYNCTNYALDLFNSARAVPLTIPVYSVVLPGYSNPYSPGAANNIVINIDKSPQMLFTTLQLMKNAGNAEAGNIVIDQSHNTAAPVSKGACN